MMSNVPYLGCKLSLVSKSEIRYDGILYTIDTKESTIALAKVRICGTEGRVTDRPVAPRAEVYEYIIFRASDIKDLHVCEAPKPQSTISSNLPNDPAIVQHSAPLATCNVQCGQSYSHVCDMPPFQHLATNLPFSMQQPLIQSQASGSRPGIPLQIPQRKSTTTDAGIQVSSDSAGTKEERDRSQDSGSESMRDNQGRQGFQSQRGYPNRRFQRGRGPRRGRGRGRSFSFQKNTETLKFDCEYDFELANAEFIELENKLSKVSGDPPVINSLAGGDHDEDSMYNREKSFFDNISCEASRVAKGIPRFDWRVERKLNVETFGASMNINWLRRRRGRGGFRGRGVFRSRGSASGRDDESAAAPLNKAAGDASAKTVTFEDQLVTAEIERPETPIMVPEPESIPVIEQVPSTEVIWEESEASKEQWK